MSLRVPSSLSERSGESLPPIAPARPWLNVVTHLDPRFGGLSAVVPQLSTGVAAAGNFAVSLAAFCAPGELYGRDNFAALHLSEWPAGRMDWLRDRALGRRFRQMLGSMQGVHIHGLWEGSTQRAGSAAREMGIPYVLSAHGMLERWALRNKRLKKWLYSALVERANVDGAACLHALTHAEAADYRRYGAHGPIAVIPNGVRIPQHLSAELFLGHNPRLRGKRIVLFLGRLHHKKGLDLLIEAWGQITRRHPDAHLVLAGPDFEGTRARVLAEIDQRGLAETVLLPGMLRDELKWSALAAAECFVLPSYSEGLSVSVLEAMGIGLPVIISEHCNLPEVGDLEAGWIIHATADALEQALEEMLRNSTAANHAIGSRGCAYVRQHYAWTQVSQQMSEVYAWTLGGEPPASVELLPGRGRR